MRSPSDHQIAQEEKEFSGYVRYEQEIKGRNGQTILEITDAYEGVEVFINEETLGIQVAPPFHYDISSNLKEGMNKIRIEVATTLERERSNDKSWFNNNQVEIITPSGINGTVNLYYV